MPTLKYLQKKFLEHLKTTPDSSSNREAHAVFSTGAPQAVFERLWRYQAQVALPDGNKSINRKGRAESESFRNGGNRLYKEKIFDKALLAYNYAILAAPHPLESFPENSDVYDQIANVLFRSEYPDEDFQQLAFAYANRSALLLEMEQFNLAILDIHNALRYGYTKSKHYKMFERKVKCLIGLEKYDEAKSLSESILNNLSKDIIDTKELSQLKSNLRKQISKCECQATPNNKHISGQGEIIKDSPNTKDQNSSKSKSPADQNTSDKFSKIFFRGSKFPPLDITDRRPEAGDISSALTVEHSTDKGRHLVATRNIEPGEVLLVEESQSSFVLHGSGLRSYCSSCLRRVVAPLPCPACSLVVFCDSVCRSAALSAGGGHWSECPILATLVALQPEVDAGLAFRVMAKMGMKELSRSLEQLSNKANANCPVDDCSKKFRETENRNELQGLLDNNINDYEFLYKLEGNYRHRSIEEKLEAGATALILVKLLLLCPDFWGAEGEPFYNLQIKEDDIRLLGGQMLRLILNIECNAHCVKELQLTDGQPLRTSKYNDVGFAVFNKLSLLNHSCAANCHQSSCGHRKILYSVSSIARGEEVTMSYGERFVSHCKEQRQKNLRDAYYFTCGCSACAHNWPVFEELSLKFTLRCCKCSSPIDAASSKCKSCQLVHKNVNAKKNKKKGKKSNQQQNTPHNIYDAAVCQTDISKAWLGYNQAYENIEKLQANCDDPKKIEILLSLMDRYAHHPNKPYIEAQETLIRWFDLKSAASFHTE